MVELILAAMDSFMTSKRDSDRDLSILGGNFKVAMAVAAFSMDEAVDAPSDRVMASSKLSGFGEAAGIRLWRPT